MTFSEEDLAFIRLWAGGHPALLETTCRILGMLTGRPVRDASQDWIIHRRAAEVLAQDLNIQAECRKIWNDLTEPEQEALLQRRRRAARICGRPGTGRRSLAKHLVVGAGAERHIFARTFAEFVQPAERVAAPRRPGYPRRPGERRGVGERRSRFPTLTNLEYRLLLLLYGRLGKICTKYDVVEAVWGEDYIDEVDDARIEKLVSRLRQKIEPDAANPRYLLTVRGRGYKLAEG